MTQIFLKHFKSFNFLTKIYNHLFVFFFFSEPRVRLIDENEGLDVTEKHVNIGSMIELKCIIDRIPFPHLLVTWRRGHTTLVFNNSRGGIRSVLIIIDIKYIMYFKLSRINDTLSR